MQLNIEDIKFSADDIPIPKVWKAHEDAINCVTWVPELNLISSCSFDCNVYVWNPEAEKVGSLVLGNRAGPPGSEGEAENKYRNNWRIKIDKETRFNEELKEAAQMLEEVDNMKYDDMKAKQAQKKGGAE